MPDAPVDLPNLKMLEREIIEIAARKYPNRKSEVAKALGISLKAYYNKLNEYGLPVRPCRRTPRRRTRQ